MCTMIANAGGGLPVSLDQAKTDHLNLVINNDFTNPVNRQGESEYIWTTGSLPTIDRWQINGPCKLTLATDGITLSCTAEGHFQWLQIVPVWTYRQLINEQVTLTVLTADNELYSVTGVVPETIVDDYTVVAGTEIPGFSTFMLCIEKSSNLLYISFNNVNGTGTETKKFVGIKLEFGDTQTYAHQDASGQWIRDDFSQFELQYLLCSLWNPDTDHWWGIDHCHKVTFIHGNFYGIPTVDFSKYKCRYFIPCVNSTNNLLDANSVKFSGSIDLSISVRKFEDYGYPTEELEKLSALGDVSEYISLIYTQRNGVVIELDTSTVQGNQYLVNGISANGMFTFS